MVYNSEQGLSPALLFCRWTLQSNRLFASLCPFNTQSSVTFGRAQPSLSLRPEANGGHDLHGHWGHCGLFADLRIDLHSLPLHQSTFGQCGLGLQTGRRWAASASAASTELKPTDFQSSELFTTITHDWGDNFTRRFWPRLCSRLNSF